MVANLVATTYDYLQVDRVQCPKCGEIAEIPLHSNTGHGLEYAGVCQTRLDNGTSCGAMLILQVTAHIFPVLKTETDLSASGS